MTSAPAVPHDPLAGVPVGAYTYLHDPTQQEDRAKQPKRQTVVIDERDPIWDSLAKWSTADLMAAFKPRSSEQPEPEPPAPAKKVP